MQSGYYNTTGGMVTQFNRLDLISNNLANLNTTGFKRDDVVIGDYLRLFETHKEQLPIEDHTRKAAKFINRTMNRVPIISEEYTDRSVGNLAQTDNPLDFALQKENAFFAIKTPDGIRYTRDGSFSIDSNGYLVNKSGHLVISRDGLDSQEGIHISVGLNLEADTFGNLYVRNLNNDAIAEQINIGSLAIVSFENPRYLKKVGQNLYEFPTQREDERDLVHNAILAQGFIEKSNVNAVREMSSLIETNRLVDMYSKVMKSHMDDLNIEAITKLAVRA
ncbi:MULTISPECIES: flagellar hook-basal body protein [Helicobacter]|uniref:Flagellar basal-body rod protein FlgG n=2 Tax=Helicobacter typhlonius TaxID=76936 RepID=A0A099UCV9_9HELI|nr:MULTISPECIES: flagellar hook-basal body protein [Helicobacter]TLD78131.1 flagellar hook-basal body protein [Helicobacter typhlonius]TLD86432.1 flagellar hook-basal body protein [Helicobacter sp. MIT 03-1616]CUU39072.1 Flagellar basal-body rod protein FlgG [Helicobacter typhlonius]HCD73199.1 flagellar hook-basal body protein [Helicobacter sp.]